MSDVFFLRHGETDSNLHGIAQGHLDVPLNATGRGQALRAAEALRDTSLASIVSSPLGRAHDTAKAVAAHHGGEITLDEDLMEICLGVLQGQKGSDFGRAFKALWDGGKPPEGGETLDAFKARCLRGFEAAIALPRPVLIVAHGGVWRVLSDLLPIAPSIRAANATPFRLSRAGAGWTVEVVA